MHHIFTIVFLLLYLVGSSQTIDPSRSVNWTLAGLKDTTTLGFLSINLNDYGLDKSGLTPNDSVINAILNAVPESGAILNFPAGNFLFSKAPFVVACRACLPRNASFATVLQQRWQ